VKLYVAHPDEESDKGRIMSDAWGLDSHLRDLVLVNVSSGLVDVLARNQRVSFFRIFPDGARAAFPVHSSLRLRARSRFSITWWWWGF